MEGVACRQPAGVGRARTAKHSLQPFKARFAESASSSLCARRKIDPEHHAGVSLRFRYPWPVFGQQLARFWH